MCTAIGGIYKLDAIEAWFRQLLSGCVIDEVIFFFYNHKLQDVEPICFYTSFVGSCFSLLEPELFESDCLPFYNF